MKTDYRVICCIVVGLCCAAVNCRKVASDWNNIDRNRIQDFGREYDGDGDIPYVLKEEEDTCQSKCGLADGMKKNDDVECDDTSAIVTCKCLKNPAQKFDDTSKQCVDTCQSKCGLADGIKKNDDVECDDTSAIVTCKCLKNPAQKFDDTSKQCVDTCQSKCGLADGITKNDDVECDDTSGTITCKCVKNPAQKFNDTAKQCVDTCESKCGVKEGKKENDVVKCEEASGTITCKCIKNPAQKFDIEKKQCVDTCESKCGIDNDQIENEEIKCDRESDSITCECKKGTDLAFDYSKKKCIACNCGTDSTGCTFGENGKICQCKEKYADKNGTCVDCKCGEKSTGCKFEGDKKTCLCEDKFADKQGTCSECGCGPNSNGKCKFVGDKKVCSCKKGYEDKNGICEMTKCTELCGEGYDEKKIQCIPTDKGGVPCKCTEKLKGFDYTNKVCKDCDCGPMSKECMFIGEKKICLCKDGHADKEGTCAVCKCGKDSIGCSFDENGKTCKCKPKYADKEGTCVDCKCGVGLFESCFFKEKEKTCNCIKEYAQNNGTCQKDYCQIKCGCELDDCGGETDCEGNKFEESKVKCSCVDEKKFDASVKKCRTPCKITEGKSNCENGAECKGSEEEKFCKCHPGTSGDTCGEVDECAEDKKFGKCEGDRGNCKFDVKSKSPVCICEAGKELDKVKNYCVDKFCVEDNCKDNSTCEYDKNTHTGHCMCSEGKYYDYRTNLCRDPNKCILKKTPCKENEVCENGECKCPYEKDGDKCIKKFCKSDTCFPGSKCNEEEASCTCEEGKVFTGTRCEDKKCILKDNYEKECNCPRLMDKKDDKCVPRSGNLCDTDCGYGICVNSNCRCFEGAVTVNKICVLDKSVCASKKLMNGSRSQCQCEHKYKQAKDGNTCEPVTCEDEYAKNYCAQRGATCTMKWTAPPQFDCECPGGYVMDNDRDICTDPCSLQKNIDTCLKNNKFCFNSISSKNFLTGDCRCPPPFTDADGCKVLDTNVHLISGISVQRKFFETKNGINYVLLNALVTQSLAQTYSADVFDYGYLFDYEVNNDKIIFSVWARFKQNASEQIQRIPFQAKQFSGVCEDCDKAYIWPPSLLLSEEGLEKVSYEELDLCSTAVKDKLCGKEAECETSTGCYCPRGFRMLEYTALLTADNRRILRCEATSKVDLNECEAGTHKCPKNTDCVKIPGDYICQCKPGYWKENNYDKADCKDLCAKNPCSKGKCSMQKDSFNCQCEPGYGGSRCDAQDVNFASAKKGTVIVGAILGTILIIGILAFLLYYRKIRKSSYSEDFMPSPPSHAEMTERRPMRGVVNKSYE